jgi:hypothetical protein
MNFIAQQSRPPTRPRELHLNEAQLKAIMTAAGLLPDRRKFLEAISDVLSASPVEIDDNVVAAAINETLRRLGVA